jgi:hypothetical protein
MTKKINRKITLTFSEARSISIRRKYNGKVDVMGNKLLL